MFSVVIPVYNHAAFLRTSLHSALRSPLVSEVLLLDDGSNDGSRELLPRLVAGAPRARDLTPPGGGNRGAHARLNELVAASKCEWIAVLNSDDVFVDGRFEAVVSDPLFEESDFVFGNLLLMNASGALIGAKRGPFDTGTAFPGGFDVPRMIAAGQFLDLLAHQNYLGTTSNMVFRKDLHARVGGFRPYRYVHDWDFALRAMAIGQPLYVQRYLTAYRVHGRNTIAENAHKVRVESKDVFDRFVEDFPRIASRPTFQDGFESNVDVAPLRAGVALV